MTENDKSAGGRVASGNDAQTGLAPPALPMRAGHLPLREIIDLYMAHYAGRDGTRVQRLAWWQAQVGTVPLQDLTDDHVHAAIEALSAQSSRFFAGKDADGKQIFRARKKPMAPATLNRYTAALASVITWSIKKRIAPRGLVHPVRTIERRAENNEKLRFLSDAERTALLSACRLSRWPRLYVLTLMALTTGARKGELIGLTWADVDFDEAVAHVGLTKNGQPRVLPLVPAVVAELKQFKAGASSLLFPSRRDPRRAFGFDPLFRQALQAAHIRGVTFHTLRHTCASSLAKNDCTLLEIADVLGHRQLQMTKRYSHLTTGHKSRLVNRVLGDLK